LDPVNIGSNNSCDFHANSCDNNQQKVYKFFSLNFRGLLSKKHFQMIYKEVSHFAGTESWPTVYSSEVIPPDYEIILFRNDRPDGCGGVCLPVINLFPALKFPFICLVKFWCAKSLSQEVGFLLL